MDKTSSLLAAGSLALLLVGFAGESRAQDDADQPELGWSNSTELNLVISEGNTSSSTLGFKNNLRRRWKLATFQLKLDGYEFNEADDRFLQVAAGQTWLPGETPEISDTFLVEPGVEPDLAKYSAEGKYTRTIGNKTFWNAGASWDRNEDAGILNRYRVFGGLGRDWRDVERLHFSTSYGLSYTDREEENPDPEKDEEFLGLRLGWDYRQKFGKNTTYDNDFSTNMSLADTSDFSIIMDNTLAVTMTSHLSLRVGLKFLYENEPALEDVDVVVLFDLIDEDEEPGSGDEYFVTVESGGATIELGEDRVRKKQLDMTFTVGLGITF